MAFFNSIQGCVSSIFEKIKEVLGLGTPTAYVTGAQFPSIDLQQATLAFDVLINNPSYFPIPLTDMSYSLESNTRKLVSAAVTQAETVRPNSSATIVIPVTLVFQDILRVAADFRPGSVIPYTIKVDFVVELPVFGKKTVAFDYSGEFPIPQVPIILLEKIEFLKFSFEECKVSLHLQLKNTNEFDMGVTSLDLELQIASITVGSAGLEKSGSLEKSGVSSVEIAISFKPMNSGNALWQVLGGQDATYTIKGSIGVETDFGNIKFPFSQGGSTSLIK